MCQSLGQLSVYGQESNPTTSRLAAMNMAVRGIDFNFGNEPANRLTNDLHPDLHLGHCLVRGDMGIESFAERT